MLSLIILASLNCRLKGIEQASNIQNHTIQSQQISNKTASYKQEEGGFITRHMNAFKAKKTRGQNRPTFRNTLRQRSSTIYKVLANVGIFMGGMLLGFSWGFLYGLSFFPIINW